jgi:hypothetical protein
MAEDMRIERGWIYLKGARQDDGTVKLGGEQEMRFSPFDAIGQRKEVPIPLSAVWKASVQRLVFWRR